MSIVPLLWFRIEVSPQFEEPFRRTKSFVDWNEARQWAVDELVKSRGYEPATTGVTVQQIAAMGWKHV